MSQPLNVSWREATIHDAAFVATVMSEAVGIPMMEQGKVPGDNIVALCRRTDTLYSYKNTIIAVVDGIAVGGLISYDGTGYHEIKNRTFSLVEDILDFDPTTMDDETRQGEYYLDSAAVLPQWRGKGLGRMLIEQGLAMARKSGLLAVLACDPNNTGAHALYTSMGFKHDGDLYIFGERYLRLIHPNLY